VVDFGPTRINHDSMIPSHVDYFKYRLPAAAKSAIGNITIS